MSVEVLWLVPSTDIGLIQEVIHPQRQRMLDSIPTLCETILEETMPCHSDVILVVIGRQLILCTLLLFKAHSIIADLILIQSYLMVVLRKFVVDSCLVDCRHFVVPPFLCLPDGIRTRPPPSLLIQGQHNGLQAVQKTARSLALSHFGQLFRLHGLLLEVGVVVGKVVVAAWNAIQSLTDRAFLWIADADAIENQHGSRENYVLVG